MLRHPYTDDLGSVAAHLQLAVLGQVHPQAMGNLVRDETGRVDEDARVRLVQLRDGFRQKLVRDATVGCLTYINMAGDDVRCDVTMHSNRIPTY